MADHSIVKIKQNNAKHFPLRIPQETSRNLKKLLIFSMNEKENCFSQGRQYIIFCAL